MACVAGVARVAVHAARRLAVAAGVAVTGHRTGAAAAAAHRVQRWRIRGVRARCQLIVRHSRVRAAEASRRLSTVHLERIARKL